MIYFMSDSQKKNYLKNNEMNPKFFEFLPLMYTILILYLVSVATY